MTPVIKKEVSVKEEEVSVPPAAPTQIADFFFKQDDGFDSDDERELQRLIRENERIESVRTITTYCSCKDN